MMRSLWTGASGMTSQQLQVDTIANNIANVNTTGYKKERLEFESLMYQTMKKATVSADSGLTTPVNLQVGHGVRPVASSRMFDQGSFERTENKIDFALQGEGFFTIEYGLDENGDPGRVYTKDGSFDLTPENGMLVLVTNDGYPVLDINGDRILIDPNIDFTVDLEGNFTQVTSTGGVDMGIRFDIVQFTNQQGLEAIGSNFYKPTIASGEAISESEDENLTRTEVRQGALEMSNVQIADEMVKLIVAQRAYELNSKSITTSDEMLQLANELKR